MKLGKTRRYKICVFLILLLLPLNESWCAARDLLQTIPADSLREVQLRSFSQKSIDSLLQLKDFQYFKPEASKSRFWDWLTKFISKVLGRSIDTLGIPIWFWYLVMSLLTIFIIYKIFRSNFRSVIYNPAETSLTGMEGIPENIHTINFDDSISKALAVSDFRTALRFHYLKFLKLMFDKGLIQYRKEKSNHDYQAELANHHISLMFSRLTLIYEWVWYGKIYVDSEAYLLLKPDFEKAYLEVNE